jgi:hypothetical protein
VLWADIAALYPDIAVLYAQLLTALVRPLAMLTALVRQLAEKQLDFCVSVKTA